MRLVRTASNIFLVSQARACLPLNVFRTYAQSFHSNTTMSTVDVLIIGGGPAGLAVATGLARQLYTAVVFDSGVYRNARTKHMHNVPTWDHRDPADFRAKARSDLLARYETIRFEETKIELIQRTETGRFEATDTNGKKWTGKKLALASGMIDIYPEIPGYDDVWGRGVYVLYLWWVNDNVTG
jgi:thioredoxin reductase